MSIKSIIQDLKSLYKVKQCVKELVDRIHCQEEKNFFTSLPADKYTYAQIVDAMTFVALKIDGVIVFPNNKIRTQYLETYEHYSSRTSTIELMGTLENSIVLVPPVDTFDANLLINNILKDQNNNSYLVTF